MTTRHYIPDNVDDDSSFEMIDEMKFDNIKNLDDEKYENFQLVSRNGTATKEVNVNENSSPVPILTEILGKWKLIPSPTLEEDIKALKLSEATANSWRNGIVCYENRGGILHVHTEISKKVQNRTPFPLNTHIPKGKTIVMVHIENNKLITLCANASNGSMLWKTVKHIQNGKLFTTTNCGNSNVVKIYERVN